MATPRTTTLRLRTYACGNEALVGMSRVQVPRVTAPCRSKEVLSPWRPMQGCLPEPVVFSVGDRLEPYRCALE